MPAVRFNFRDSRGRSTSRTFWTVAGDVATAIADATALAALWDPITDLQLVDVTITYQDSGGAFAGAAVSNIDENVSIKAQGGDGRIYDVDLPDVPDTKTPTELVDPADLDIAAFFAAFGSLGQWRVNLNNPTTIDQVISGKLDK